MIVHSTRNRTDDTCMVQVEGIDPALRDLIVLWFARGAAAKHNPGYQITTAAIVEWLDDDGRAIPEGYDTSRATGARVLCAVGQP